MNRNMRSMAQRTALPLCLLGLGLFAIASASQAARDLDTLLSHLPKNLTLKETGPQKYSFICDYFMLDPTGNLLNKERVSGDYTRGLPDAKARWSNVRVAQAKGLNDVFPDGAPQKYMEGFSYSTSNLVAVADKDFFPGFPPAAMNARNLVWDTVMFESFAAASFDDLALNQPHQFIKEEDVNLAGVGNFHNQNVELTWTGISKYNGVECALIRYEAFFNTLAVSVPGYSGKGRSHYWGEMWISLRNRQIECGTLREDVLLEGAVAGQPNKILSNVFRKGVFQKAR